MPRRLERDFATQHIFSVITCFHFFLLCSHLQLTERGWRRVYKNLSTHFSHHFKVGCTRCCITYFYLKISHIMLLILGPQTESLGKFLLHTKVREPRQKGLGEPSKRIFGKSWAFGPTSGPPPLPVSWAAQKRKKKLMFILHFRLF